jgi:Domain of unknown function (DUF4331)
MSHHYSGPNFGFPHGNPRLDFTDLYAFPKPGDASKSILIMDVHPSVSFEPAGPTITTPFATDALYEMKIDTDGDLVANIIFSVRFATADGGEQTATLRRVDGAQATGTGENGRIICAGAPVSTGREAAVTSAGGCRFFAGWRSDPFFFDTVGAVNNLQFTSTDYFLDKNVCSIALEVPNAELGTGTLGLWARTLDGASGTWVQADRGSKPSQTPFLTGDFNSAYLGAQPSEDAQFVSAFAHALEHAGGYTPQEATLAAALLLPDILHYEVTHQASYPNNGRALTDDASGHFLAVLTNGKLTSVGLPHHTDLLDEFPYVGPPHATG